MSDAEQIVRSMYGGFSGLAEGGDVTAYVRAHWTDDCVYEPVEEAKPVRGHQAMIEWNERWFEAWEQLEATVQELRTAGTLVFAEVSIAGRGGESGLEIGMRVFHVIEPREGRLARMREFLDRDEALAAAGLPPHAKED